MLGEAGDGDDQEADQEPADHHIGGKEEALPPLEPLAVGVAKELGELLVDLNAGQKPREARAETPEFAPRGVASARREKPQDHGAEPKAARTQVRGDRVLNPYASALRRMGRRSAFRCGRVDRRKQPQTDTKMRAEDTIRLNFRRSEHRLAAIFMRSDR
jgi:hypothetical protein